MPPKYSLSDCSKEEVDLFMKELGELLNKHSLYFEPVPKFTRDGLVQEDGKPYPWKIVCEILLNKKVEIVEATKEEGVPSPFTDESNKEN